MSSTFRRLAKSKVGTALIGLVGVLILVGFAMGDIQNVISGGAFSGGSDTLVKLGPEKVSDREMSRAMDRRLSQVRQENPEATYAMIVGDFDQLLSALVDAKTLEAFAEKFGMTLSRRLEDAQIANIPAARGLNGEFSEQSYRNFLGQQRITDEEVATDRPQRALAATADRARRGQCAERRSTWRGPMRRSFSKPARVTSRWCRRLRSAPA